MIYIYSVVCTRRDFRLEFTPTEPVALAREIPMASHPRRLSIPTVWKHVPVADDLSSSTGVSSCSTKHCLSLTRNFRGLQVLEVDWIMPLCWWDCWWTSPLTADSWCTASSCCCFVTVLRDFDNCLNELVWRVSGIDCNDPLLPSMMSVDRCLQLQLSIWSD